jgi:1-acyl-sn-glycerol-3-phosphate acyltransferase
VSIERKPAKWVQRTLLGLIRGYLEHRSSITVERNDTRHMKPPYLILSNHVNNWDPLFLNCYVDEPICFVAGAPLFRNPILKRILNYTGAISKTKFRADTSTIRNVLKAKKHRRVIGLFPEGNRNWDGRTEPLVYSTAKLVKALDIPVVIAKIRGGYLSHPRWADGHRRGPVSITFEKKWDRGDLALETPDSIHRMLTAELAHDEAAWQAEHGHRYTGKQTACYLERLLFICPHCETASKLYSHGNILECRGCGYAVRYTESGRFAAAGPGGPEPVFEVPADWNAWQLAYLDKLLADPASGRQWRDSLRDPVQLYVSADEDQPFRRIGTGTLSWSGDRLIFEGEGGRRHAFPLDGLDGLNIQFHHKLDFFEKNRFYRIVFHQPRSSAFKWLKSIQAAQAGTMEATEVI